MPGPDPIVRVAVDTGGTFTDLVARTARGAVVRAKVPSTPDDPGRAILAALEQVGGAPEAALRHGTTVATNALLERAASERNKFIGVLLACTHGRGAKRYFCVFM